MNVDISGQIQVLPVVRSRRSPSPLVVTTANSKLLCKSWVSSPLAVLRKSTCSRKTARSSTLLFPVVRCIIFFVKEAAVALNMHFQQSRLLSTPTPLPFTAALSRRSSLNWVTFDAAYIFVLAYWITNWDLYIVPGILSQLGPDSLASLRKLAEAYTSAQGAAGAGNDDDDEIPDLVESFDKAEVEDKKEGEEKKEEPAAAASEEKKPEAEKSA